MTSEAKIEGATVGASFEKSNDHVSKVTTQTVEMTAGAAGVSGFVSYSKNSQGSSQTDVGVKAEYVTQKVNKTSATFSFKFGISLFKSDN